MAPDVVDSSFVAVPRGDLARVDVDGEAILLDGRTGQLHLLNPTATIAWDLLAPGMTLSELSAELSEAFGADVSVIRADLGDLVANLRARQLLDERGEGSGQHDERTPPVQRQSSSPLEQPGMGSP